MAQKIDDTTVKNTLNPMKGTLLGPTGGASGPWYDPAGIFGGGSKPKAGPDPVIPNAGEDGRGDNSVDYWIHNQQNPYAGSSGIQNNIMQQAWASFQNVFGRAPTNDEMASVLPAFQSTDPNKSNLAGGEAQVAALYQQQQNTPEEIYKRQQAQYLKDAPKYADQVNQTFQSLLGRQATADEATHFGALIAAGQDPYQIQQALQQTQEYQNTQNTNFQNQLQNQLQGSNSTYFNQYILPAIQAKAAQAGRSLDSSGVNAQLGNAALQQNQGLQQFLAGITAQNYGNSTANATNQYNQLMGQQYGLQNAGVSNTLANNAANTQYNQNLNMYQMQQQAYQNYLQNYGKTNGWQSVLGGASKGAGAGAAFGPYGALAGGILGGIGGGAAANNSGGGATW